MKKLAKSGLAAVAVCLGLVVCMSVDSTQARPQYNKEFQSAYPNVADAAKEAGCGVCHPGPKGKDKKKRNAYGMAFEEGLGDEKNVKGDGIGKALEAAGKAKSSVEGKTFGDLIKDGKLPE